MPWPQGEAQSKKKQLEAFLITEIVECPFYRGWHGGEIFRLAFAAASHSSKSSFRRLPQFGRLWAKTAPWHFILFSFRPFSDGCMLPADLSMFLPSQAAKDRH